MTKPEKLSWTIAIVGLVASLISIFAFVTGASSVPSIVRTPKVEPKPTVVIQKAPVPVQDPKKDTPGDKIAAPLKNGANWISGRLQKRSRPGAQSEDQKSSSQDPTKANP